MNLHANAALSLNKRRDLCQRVVVEGWTLTKAVEAAEVSVRCARKWVGRYRSEGELGLLDRSSAPLSIPHRTNEERVQAIAALRRLRFTGPEIAELLGMALSTVSGILTRIGMGKLGRLGLEPAQRYERQRPGELIHIDVKKLGRIEGGAGQSSSPLISRHSRRYLYRPPRRSQLLDCAGSQQHRPSAQPRRSKGERSGACRRRAWLARLQAPSPRVYSAIQVGLWTAWPDGGRCAMPHHATPRANSSTRCHSSWSSM
jgi:transposase